MDNEQRLFAMRASAKNYLEQSKDFIRNIVPKRLSAELEEWLSKRRLMDPAIFISRAICNLEGCVYGGRELRISVLAGCAAAVSDDLIDSQSNISLDKLRLLGDYVGIEEEGNLGLFYVFNQGLLGVLPANFGRQFNSIIREYGKAQEDSARLFNPAITREEIVDIKNRAGGYSVLLLHAMMFPYEPLTEINSDYQRNRTTKQEALYTYGAWLSRVDDLWDVIKDRSRGMRQLATERIVTWESLTTETQQMKECLEDHFPKARVEMMMEEHYAPLIDIEIFTKYGNGKE